MNTTTKTIVSAVAALCFVLPVIAQADGSFTSLTRSKGAYQSQQQCCQHTTPPHSASENYKISGNAQTQKNTVVTPVNTAK